MKRFVLALALAAVAILTAAVTASPAKTTAAFKACWIYVGPHNDGGWSQAHDAGRLYVQHALGNKVTTTYKENVPEGPNVASVISGFIGSGCKVIFATSYGFQPAMLAAAAKNPDVKFEMATGDKKGPANMSDYYGAGEDAIYLSGIAAGAAAKPGSTVGYVVPFAIPEVIRHTNAFTLGVRKANPTAKVKIVWTNSWFSPQKETQAAQSLHSAGATVLGQNVDSPATGKYAQSVGIPWVGYDSDAQKAAPKAWLTAAVYNWGPYYLREVKAAMDGSWRAGNYYGSLKDGFTALAPFGSGVSAKTRQLIAAQEKLIKSGKWNEFSGPIRDQAGKVVIKKGHRPTFAELYSMSYLVQGVVGSPKG
jgi:basic membrane protein A